MKFGTFPVEQAEGLVLAHLLRLEDGALPKGHRLTAVDVNRLIRHDMETVIAVRLDPGDLGEDEAADRIAAALMPAHCRSTEARTGRVNLYATQAGLFVPCRDAVDRLNRIDPSVTFACLESHVPVASGEMIATVKIIPLAVEGRHVEQAESVARERPLFELLPFLPHAITLVATQLPSLKPSVMDKTARVLTRRLALSGSSISREIRTAHEAQEVASAIAEAAAAGDPNPLVVIFGASALCDFDDVIPAAIRLAGGDVVHAGLPVDPGNLLVLGRLGDMPIIGAPGCARSPAENGFDWVLNRILAGIFPDRATLTGFGVGGLLKEIPVRPSPRDAVEQDKADITVAGLVLAAGRASRMGEGGHKLLAEFDGEPLVHRSARVLIEGGISPVAVVTGHRAPEITAAVADLPVMTIDNPDHASGMASSLVAGIVAPALASAEGVLVMLADMPGVSTGDIARLLNSFREEQGRAVVRAVSGGKRGNPVILPRATFAAIRRLEGDTGARAIIETSGLPVIDVDIGESAHLDVDTPEAVRQAGGILKG